MIFGFNTDIRRQIALPVVCCLLVASPSLVHAGYDVVEIQEIQLAKSLSATVTDQGGFPVPGAKVEEMNPGWKRILRSTQADNKGRFTLAPVPGREIYYLQISYPTFDPLRVRVSISVKNGKELKLRLVVAT
jgi:hypothetical protein